MYMYFYMYVETITFVLSATDKSYILAFSNTLNTWNLSRSS